MSYQVDTIENFEREAKRLKKKFPSLRQEINDLIDALEENPFLGVALQDSFWVLNQKAKVNAVVLVSLPVLRS